MTYVQALGGNILITQYIFCIIIVTCLEAEPWVFKGF